MEADHDIYRHDEKGDEVRISGNQYAREVKLADLRHNSDLSRLDSIDEKVIGRMEKYKSAIAILES